MSLHALSVLSGDDISSGRFVISNHGTLRVYVTSAGIWRE